MNAQWTAQTSPFKPIAITAEANILWLCGVNSGIASSKDGVTWTTHKVSGQTATFLGIAFFSKDFGYAFGTAGNVAMTADGGETWTNHAFGTETIIAASFADSSHGIFRTAATLNYVSGPEILTVNMPKNVPAAFHYVPAVAALSADKMAAEVSEGWKSRAGFVSTIDGGKTWTFFEPPHIAPRGLLAVGHEYWSLGNETVGYDTSGNGGLGVPSAIHSSDGTTWSHSAADTKVCHWEGCDACTVAGCLASAEKQIAIVDLYGPEVKTYGVPAEHITSSWAAANGIVCTIDQNLFCTQTIPLSFRGQSGARVPETAQLPPLGTKNNEGMVRCIRCALKPLYVDAKREGDFTVHLVLILNEDGTVSNVDVMDVPTEEVKKDLLAQSTAWLFEPPMKDGRPVKVKLAQAVHIHLLRSR